MFGARMGIMWEEQLVDPPIDCIIPGINEEGSTPHLKLDSGALDGG